MQVLLIIAIIPSLFLGWFIYKHDTQEKEPAGLLVKLFIGGVLAIPLTLFIELGVIDTIFEIDEEKLTVIGTALYYFLYVGFVEEGSKWIFLKLFSWKSKEFNYLYDGLVYAAFVTLGFATIENILYVFEGGIVTGIMRAILSVPGHFFFGISMGYFFAKAKESQVLGKNDKVGSYLFLSFLVPGLLHGLFDTLLSYDSWYPVIIYFIFVIILYIVSFRLILKLSKITTDLGGMVRANQQIRYNNMITQEQYNQQMTSYNQGFVSYQQQQNIPVMNVPVMPKANFCGYCGTKLNGNSRCPSCGANAE